MAIDLIKRGERSAPLAAGDFDSNMTTIETAIADLETKTSPERYAASFGVVGGGVTNDAPALQAALDFCASNKKTLIVPDGIYRINTPLTLRNGAHLRLSQGAVIRAGTTMTAMLTTVENDWLEWHENTHLSGGVWDCNNLAQTGIHLRFFRSFFLTDTVVLNATGRAYRFGSTTALTASFELLARSIKADRSVNITMPSGSVGIGTENCNDCHFNDILLISHAIGVQGDIGASHFIRVHCWIRPDHGYLLTKGFDISGWNNFFIGCAADIPNTIGFHLKQHNNVLISCRVTNAPLAQGGTDNVMVGVRIEAGIVFRAIACSFTGYDTTRLAKDFDGDLAHGLILGTINSQVVTTSRDRMPKSFEQFPVGLQLQESAHATSRRVSIMLGNWQILQDIAGNGVRDFGIYSSDYNSTPFWITSATGPAPGWAGFSHPATGGDRLGFSFGGSSGAININGAQVLSGRKPGWAAATGTATRTTFATGTVTTAQLAERVKALLDDLIAHGIIGT